MHVPTCWATGGALSGQQLALLEKAQAGTVEHRWSNQASRQLLTLQQLLFHKN
jgi:hypothetical protein